MAEAAAGLFINNGYAETTIAQIADEAGVSPQLVYAAFGGKARLLWAAIDRVAAGDDEPVLMRDRPESLAVAAITDPHDRMRAAAGLIGALNARVGPLVMLLHRAAGSDRAIAELEANLVVAQREDYRVIAERLASGMRPDLGLEGVADMARVICGVQVWHGFVVEAEWTQEQYVEWLGDALIRLVVAGSR